MNVSWRSSPKSKKFAPSVKKGRFSGKNSANRVRLTWRLSASTSAKSGLIVRTASSWDVTW